MFVNMGDRSAPRPEAVDHGVVDKIISSVTGGESINWDSVFQDGAKDTYLGTVVAEHAELAKQYDSDKSGELFARRRVCEARDAFFVTGLYGFSRLGPLGDRYKDPSMHAIEMFPLLAAFPCPELARDHAGALEARANLASINPLEINSGNILRDRMVAQYQSLPDASPDATDYVCEILKFLLILADKERNFRMIGEYMGPPEYEPSPDPRRDLMAALVATLQTIASLNEMGETRE